MQPLSNNVRGCFTIEFQSSSGQKAGCNSRVDSYCLTPRAFQSSSGQKAGCNIFRRGLDFKHYACFNPHPARRPDATLSGP